MHSSPRTNAALEACVTDPDPNDLHALVVEIVTAIRKLEQGTHMRSLLWFMIILTVTNVVIAVAQIVLVTAYLHRL